MAPAAPSAIESFAQCGLANPTRESIMSYLI